MLFSSISGDGLSGTLTQPSSPYSYLWTQETGSPDGLGLAERSYSSNGLTVNGEELDELSAGGLYFEDFTFPATYVDPTAYFSSHTGSYTPQPGGQILVRGDISGPLAFTPTNVTIEAIPEPATLAFVGIFGGGLWLVRRFFPSV